MLLYIFYYELYLIVFDAAVSPQFHFSSALQRPLGPVWAFLRKTFFKHRSKSRFDTIFRIYAKFPVDLHPWLIQRCFLRRVMAPQR